MNHLPAVLIGLVTGVVAFSIYLFFETIKSQDRQEQALVDRHFDLILTQLKAYQNSKSVQQRNKLDRGVK